MNAIETIDYKGYTINVHYDSYVDCPFEAMDQLGTLYAPARCMHPGTECIDALTDDNGCINARRLDREYIWLEVWKYEHGGVAFRATERGAGRPFSCPWDSGRWGIIAVRKDTVRKEYGCKRITAAIREKVIGLLESEIETFSQWANGDVFGYTITDSDDNEIQDGSCWGFYGWDHEESGLLEYAKDAIDCELAQLTEQAA